MKRKRGFIILIILIILLLVPTVLAKTETTVTNGWRSYRSTLTTNGNNYTINANNVELKYTSQGEPIYDNNDGVLVIKKNGKGSLIPYDKCEITLNHKYCFLNKSYENNKIDINPQGKIVPAIYVKLVEYTYASTIEKTKTYERTAFNLHEKSDVTLSLKNVGDYTLTNVRVIETIPEGFKVTWMGSGWYKGDNNTIKYNTNILSGNTKKTKYTIQSIKYGEYTTNTKVMYNTPTESNVETNIASTTLKTIEPYTLKVELPTTALRDSRELFKMNITNNEDKTLVLKKLIITPPLNMPISEKKNLGKYNYQYKITNVKIAPKESKEFNLKATAVFVGTQTFSYKGEIELKGYTYNISGSKNITISTNKLDCFFTFEPASINFGETTKYEAELTNNDENNIFYEVNGTIITPTKNYTFYERNIKEQENKLVLLRTFTPPFSLKDENYTFIIKAAYRNGANQKYSCESEYQLLVSAASTLINWSIQTNQSIAKPGENITVQIIGENFLNNSLTEATALIKDESTTNKKIEIVSFKPLETKEIYTYKLTIPKSYSKNIFTITANLSFKNFTYTDSTEKSITITQPEMPATNNTANITTNPIPKTNQDNTSKNKSVKIIKIKDTIEQPPTGFINKLKYLFRSIFS